MPVSEDHRLPAARGAELFEYRLHVLLHGAIGNAEPAADQLVGQSLAEQQQHFDLARAEIYRVLRWPAVQGGERVLQVVDGHFGSPLPDPGRVPVEYFTLDPL